MKGQVVERSPMVSSESFPTPEHITAWQKLEGLRHETTSDIVDTAKGAFWRMVGLSITSFAFSMTATASKDVAEFFSLVFPPAIAGEEAAGMGVMALISRWAYERAEKLNLNVRHGNGLTKLANIGLNLGPLVLDQFTWHNFPGVARKLMNYGLTSAFSLIPFIGGGASRRRSLMNQYNMEYAGSPRIADSARARRHGR